MYYSTRTENVDLVFAQATSNVVVTATPTDITATTAVSGGTVILPEGSHVFQCGVCWSTVPNPHFDDSHTTEGYGTGSFTSTMRGLSENTTYYVRAYAVGDHGLIYGNELSFTTEAQGGTHEYVDLDLPSGTLWATCNVGANAPEEYGDYFAWGETQTKSEYNWSTYLYYDGNNVTKYTESDGLSTLLPEDDAATANWGSDWRMPTQEEFQELYNNTTVTLTTQNGVNGRLFTASNGNSLFLPAAGYYENDNHSNISSGDYWSSSLYIDYMGGAWYFFFFSDNCEVNYYGRYYGLSVRPVRSAQSTSFIINATANPTEGGTVTGGGTYQEGQSCTLTATANEGYTFTNWTENDTVVSTDATYSFTVEANRALVANFAVSSDEGHEYVDLGLPSGTLWATCNVGANAPEEYGNYFAWGETQPKDTYNLSTYQHCNGTENTLTKYCNDSSYGYNGFTDELTTLLPEDDAATANWGTDWRMPTKEEWQELYQNTTVTWTSQNGVSGRLFTASNGNSLFLPAAGYHLNNSLYYDGVYSYYWSSWLYTDHPNYAWNLYISSEGYYLSDFDRTYGRSVRPVRAGSQNTTPTGAINGKFSINNSGDQVYFSQGNLQYQASTNTWRFAENQWDYVGTQTPDNYGLVGGTVTGSDNRNISQTYSGWIDLFGWGTSGYNHGANCYQPWSTSTSYSDYYAYGSLSSNLYNQTGMADWGVYNPLSNGGNQTNQWRTLTQPEWNYVFYNRSTTSGIRFAKAKVNDVNGVILLPDDWSSDTYNLSNANTNGVSYSSNVITASQWNTLEQAGAVFLPSAGYRYGTSVCLVAGYGYYWSSSYFSTDCARGISFDDANLGADESRRGNGQSVRLVAPAEN